MKITLSVQEKELINKLLTKMSFVILILKYMIIIYKEVKKS